MENIEEMKTQEADGMKIEAKNVISNPVKLISITNVM